MAPLTLSLIGYPVQFETMAEVLAHFGPACRVKEMTWETAWDELAKIGLYRSGPDVSQVGSSWLDGIVASGSVRPFTDEEIDSMGGASAFLPAVWQAMRLRRGSQMGTWAIPWLADARVIFYWRDMLEEAGVDEGTAFQTPEHVEETMARLRASGVAAPWGWWATTTSTMLQCASSWVWGAGGDYVSADGRQILFNRPEALRGLVAYLRLHRYMPPWVKRVGDIVPVSSFAERQAAAAIGTPGWLPFIYELSTIPDAPDRLGIATPPGPSFVGGSALVIWQHTRRPQGSVGLVRFLTGKQVQSDYVRRMQHLPARLDVLAEPPYTTDAHYQAMAEALRTGRTYPVIPKWGDIEQKLMETLTRLWNDLLADPDQDVETLARQYLDALARRAIVTLGSRG